MPCFHIYIITNSIIIYKLIIYVCPYICVYLFKIAKKKKINYISYSYTHTIQIQTHNNAHLNCPIQRGDLHRPIILLFIYIDKYTLQ